MSGGGVQAAMEAIAQGNEPKEELVFNPVTGELEAVAPAQAAKSTTKPVMTRIAKDGFFTATPVVVVPQCVCGCAGKKHGPSNPFIGDSPTV